MQREVITVVFGLGAILQIANDWESPARKLYPNLMGSTRFRIHFYQRTAAGFVYRSIRELSVPSTRDLRSRSRHASTLFQQIVFHLTRVFRTPLDQREIYFLDLLLLELIR